MKPQKITAKPQWISHDLIRNNDLAFSSNELAFLPRLIFKYQTAEFGIDLEASVNCQNLQLNGTSFRMKASQLKQEAIPLKEILFRFQKDIQRLRKAGILISCA